MAVASTRLLTVVQSMASSRGVVISDEVIMEKAGKTASAKTRSDPSFKKLKLACQRINRSRQRVAIFDAAQATTIRRRRNNQRTRKKTRRDYA